VPKLNLGGCADAVTVSKIKSDISPFFFKSDYNAMLRNIYFGEKHKSHPDRMAFEERNTISLLYQLQFFDDIAGAT
jgi:hypothetical protein